MSNENIIAQVDVSSCIQYRSWDTYDLLDDAKINKFAIDVEAERQGELMVKWLGVLHQAQVILNKRQEDLEYVEAELRIEVKRNGIDGIQKITDATAESWVITHPRRKAAIEAKNKAYSDFQYLQNARTVMDHRRDMIKVLDHLYVSGYFARPRVSDKSVEDTERELRDHTTSRLKESLEKRKANAGE